MPQLQKPLECFQPTPCPLSTIGQGFSRPDGTCSNGVLIILESLGEAERDDGLPARPHAQAGGVLERAIVRQGMDRQEFGIWNVAACHPPHNFYEGAPWEFGASAHCKIHMDQVVERFRPRLILSLGGVSFRTLTGWAGKKKSISACRGFIVDGSRYPSIPVIGSYHPSYIARGKSNVMGVLRHDLRTAVHFAKNGWARPKIQSVWCPPLEVLEGFEKFAIANPTWFLFYDIETKESLAGDESELRAVGGGRVLRKPAEDDVNPEGGTTEEEIFKEPQPEVTKTTITQIQFSLWPPEVGVNGEAATQARTLVMPFEGVYVEWARKLLALRNPKGGWNCVHRNTSVLMADGTWKLIQQVRVGEHVKTVVDGEIVPRMVTAIPRAKDSRPWLEVRVSGAYNRGVGKWGNRGIICTPDHEWIMFDGRRVETKDLVAGMAVQLSQPGSWELILGTGMGDGHIDHKGRLSLTHTNEGWARAKAANFGGIKVSTAVQGPAGLNPGSVHWGINAAVPERWRGLIYKDAQKCWRTPTARALAVFYGDDGCLAGGGKRPKANRTVHFALHKFTKEDCQKAESWFRLKFGSAKLSPHANGFVLCLHVDSSKRFFEYIAAHLHPSMEYKLPSEYRGRYDGWMERLVPQIGWVDAVVPYTSAKKYINNKYCLTVDESHCFFTRGGLLSNCAAFDDPLLHEATMKFGSYPMDAMWQWHHSQPDLPRGLQYSTSFFDPECEPWKHLADADPAGYGAKDVWELGRLVPRLTQSMKERGIYDCWRRHVHELNRILIKASARGIPINFEKQRALDLRITEAENEVFGELQVVFPEHLKKVEPKLGYVSDGVAEKQQRMALLAVGEKWERRDFSGKGVVVKPPKPPKPVKKSTKGKPRKKKGESDEQFSERLRAAERDRALTETPAGDGAVDNGDPGKQAESLDVSEHSSISSVGDGVSEFGFGDRALGDQPVSGIAGKVGPPQPILRWCRVQPFLPNSPDQIKSYLRWLEVPIPKSFKDEKETTGKEELKKLVRKLERGTVRERAQHVVLAPFVKKVLDYREFRKIRTTYIDGWRPDAQGLIHTQFTFAPATGQLSSRNPNVQNAPKRSNLADAFRETIEARPGFRLIELDYCSYHSLTLGYNALDRHFMWLARRDIHSFLCGHFLKVPGYQRWVGMLEKEDESLVDELKFWKGNKNQEWRGKPFKFHRDEKAKRAILGWGFGLGYRKLYRMNEESFESEKETKALQELLFGLFPKVAKFHDDIREKAYHQGFLLSTHGYVRWFWDVYHWQQVKDDYDPKWHEKVVVGRNGKKYKQVWGEDSESAIAFLPANDAFGHKKERMLAMEQEGLMDRFGFVNDIHDALKFHCREELVEECLERVGWHMEQPSLVLRNEVAPEGLWCAVEASVGRNWSKMETVKIPKKAVVGPEVLV